VVNWKEDPWPAGQPRDEQPKDVPLNVRIGVAVIVILLGVPTLILWWALVVWLYGLVA
jgi:hypothetical protein